MKLSEQFHSASKRHLGNAKYMLGFCFATAALALPFSPKFAVIAAAAPLVYGSLGGACALAGHGLRIAGR